ncbi:MAG: T9SS type A sorting domain-containing protein [Saprospiraceae bacterium]|nr:T9SS type A sorting domain-containing protein [Saprospiraceae bacterium]
MKKLFIVLLVLFFSFSKDLKATHYMGGEITWECKSNGNFKFIMKLYRECYYGAGSAAQFGSTETLNTTAPGFASITMTRLSGYPKDISPSCNNSSSFLHIYCNNSSPMPNAAANLGAIQENLYTSDASYPNGVPLTGVPPAGGWMFYYGSCCRNTCTNIAGMPSFRIRSIMYPYNNQNVSTCFDNSPAFAEPPPTVLCSGIPYTFNNLAWDIELDSLVYSWGQPLQSTGAPVTTYATGYSWNSPLPGLTQNSNNIPAVVDPNSGDISFKSYTSGAFVISTKVSAFKCGTKVAEIWRDIQMVLLSCGTNNPPNITPPFKNSIGQYTLLTDTVFAGELVNFSVMGVDFEFLPNGTPQTMSLKAFGSQFGNVITSTNPPSMSTTAGCLNPPCARLIPAPAPPTTPLTGQFGLQTNFSWQTDCGHITSNIGCGQFSNVYDFNFLVKDDYCPVPGVKYVTITIVVIPPPALQPPSGLTVSTNSSGNNILHWTPPIDSMNVFHTYYIYSSLNSNGPFALLDSFGVVNTNAYSHIGANGNLHPTYYYLKTISQCNGNIHSLPSDTVVSSFTDVGISKIVSPKTNGIGNNVCVTIKNFGFDTITSFNLSYNFGGSPIIENWSGTLLPHDSLDYIFTSTFNPPSSNYILCANITLANDQNSANNQKCKNINYLPPLPPPTSISVATDGLTGNNILQWTPPIDTMNIFQKYYIYTSANFNGPYLLLDSITLLNTNTYTHIGANGNLYPGNYYLKTLSNSYGTKYSLPSDTVVSSFSDVGIIKIISPASNGTGNNVSVRIKNFSYDTIAVCDVAYDFGASLSINETWSGTLLPHDSVDFTFTSPFNPPTSNYIICSNTLLPTDNYSSNNQKCKNIYHPSPLPPPILNVVLTDSLLGMNILNWIPPIDSMNVFYKYYIYSSASCNGSFSILDSVMSLSNGYYVHINANGNSYPSYYYIKTLSNLSGIIFSAPSNTVASSFPDAGVSKIISPNENAVGSNVKVTIKNFGSSTITSTNISYSIASGVPIIETWAGTLMPCDSVDYTFTTSFNPPASNYSLCSNTLLPNDKNSSNDQKCQNIAASIENIKNNNFILSQNIPNPTNKTTTINYFLPKSGNAVFKVVNIVGEQLYSNEYDSQQGENKIELNISNFESGVYYYSLEFDGVLKVKKMVVLK